jgi:hypothetical protein
MSCECTVPPQMKTSAAGQAPGLLWTNHGSSSFLTVELELDFSIIFDS